MRITALNPTMFFKQSDVTVRLCTVTQILIEHFAHWYFQGEYTKAEVECSSGYAEDNQTFSTSL